jgi:hypothetical protein
LQQSTLAVTLTDDQLQGFCCQGVPREKIWTKKVEEKFCDVTNFAQKTRRLFYIEMAPKKKFDNP